ncbi:hypothetical protein XU18_4405 [Perkinsela sp. CCAP 1560/4]|nr:hypothetical protein XU18_4405 [Perkinsela sp. CCAP 1560/4]|eukprot:KNH04315.1 hypothetical protein XU18_4405 [Perkinsela sp. CCAP 1560/4]
MYKFIILPKIAQFFSSRYLATAQLRFFAHGSLLKCEQANSQEKPRAKLIKGRRPNPETDKLPCHLHGHERFKRHLEAVSEAEWVCRKDKKCIDIEELPLL